MGARRLPVGKCSVMACRRPFADVAQSVEHLVANEKVAGSFPVVRSKRVGVGELVSQQIVNLPPRALGVRVPPCPPTFGM